MSRSFYRNYNISYPQNVQLIRREAQRILSRYQEEIKFNGTWNHQPRLVSENRGKTYAGSKGEGR